MYCFLTFVHVQLYNCKLKILRFCHELFIIVTNLTVFSGIILAVGEFRGICFDRENSFTHSDYFFVGLFVYIPKLSVYILGNIIPLRFYGFVLRLYASCFKTPENKTKKKT